MSVGVPVSKLEAVNQMLHDLGDRPVNTLSGTSRLDVTRAIASLEQASRQFQIAGWWFNREQIRLTVDGSGNYNLPANAVHVEHTSGGPASGDEGLPFLVVRGCVLYDTVNATSDFTGAPSILLKIHRLLEFTDLPSSAREYVYAAASIRNQSRAVGSEAVDRDLIRQAGSSLAIVQEEELDAEDFDLTTAPRFYTLMHNR